MTKSRPARGSLWLITKHENGRMVVLTIDRGSDGGTLPVFSHEDEAETYLWLGALEGDWQARKTTTGELISVLYGPCASVRKVALGPLPIGDGIMLDLVSVPRKRFVRSLTNVREPSAPRQSRLRTGASVGFEPSKSPQEKGTRMRGNEEPREWKGAVARYKLRRANSYEAAPVVVEDIAIPDYDMMDFGSLDRSRDGSNDRHHGPEI